VPSLAIMMITINYSKVTLLVNEINDFKWIVELHFLFQIL
jgi:hypothetical protein